MIVYSINTADGNLWRVHRECSQLYGNLKLGEAIRVARLAARAEHRRTGLQVVVEMAQGAGNLRLAHFHTCVA